MAKVKQAKPASPDDVAWIGRVLKIADERGIVYRRLTEAAGVEPQRIDKWRKGSAPTLRHLVGIARYLDVSLDWIATGRTAGAATGEGFPREEISEDERHLLWMLRSLGVEPTDAAARITLVGEAPARWLGVRNVDPSRLGNPQGDPLAAEGEDPPVRRKPAVRKR